MIEHEWINDNYVKIKLPKAVLILSKDEFVRALRRGKSHLRAKQRQEAFERGKTWEKRRVEGDRIEWL